MPRCAARAGDVLMGPKILGQVADVYKKLRFTLRFLLGNLADFAPGRDAVPYADLPATDRYILACFAGLLSGLATSYDTFQFYRAYQVRALILRNAAQDWLCVGALRGCMASHEDIIGIFAQGNKGILMVCSSCL